MRCRRDKKDVLKREEGRRGWGRAVEFEVLGEARIGSSTMMEESREGLGVRSYERGEGEALFRRVRKGGKTGQRGKVSNYDPYELTFTVDVSFT